MTSVEDCVPIALAVLKHQSICSTKHGQPSSKSPFHKISLLWTLLCHRSMGVGQADALLQSPPFPISGRAVSVTAKPSHHQGSPMTTRFRARRTESRQWSIIFVPVLGIPGFLEDRIRASLDRKWAAGMLPAHWEPVARQ